MEGEYMSNNDERYIQFKEKVYQTLSELGMRKTTTINQYRCQYCHICNDSKWHLYLKIDTTQASPMVYYCQKCKNGGVVGKSFLDYYNIDVRIPRISFRRKIETSREIAMNTDMLTQEMNLEEVCRYIELRVGHYPTFDELKSFQYVGEPERYVQEYFGDNKYSISAKQLKNRFWFRMNNGGIIGRWYNDNTKYRWIKYKTNIVDERGLYNIKKQIDLYQPIVVCIAEGVMDVIGLYYNYHQNNPYYLACLGCEYEACVRYLVSMGLFGESVHIKIFKDSNIDIRDIKINPNLKQLFGKIEIYSNECAGDYGVLPDQLEIQRVLKTK